MKNATKQNKTKQMEEKEKKRWSNQETENGLRKRAFSNNKYAGIISSWKHIEGSKQQ